MSRFYVCMDDNPELIFLCRKPSGTYEFYWSSDKSCAVKFSDPEGIPEVDLDISDARWCNENNEVLDFIF